MRDIEKIFKNFEKEEKLKEIIFEAFGEKSEYYKDKILFMTPVVLSAFQALFDFVEVSKLYNKNTFGELSYIFSQSELQTTLGALYTIILSTFLDFQFNDKKEISEFITAVLYGIIIKLSLQQPKEVQHE
jgi:hypothetical protein